MNSRVLLARVSHTRNEPMEHAFSYRFPLYLLDMKELSRLDESLWIFGYNRIRPIALFDRDYLHQGEAPIHDKLMGFLKTRDIAVADIEETYLVTAPRFFMYVFNPVSFYFLLGRTGLVALVAEVNNTFGEKHLYLLGENGSKNFPVSFRTAKAFHVSPFFDRSGEYHFLVDDIRKRLDIRIRLVRDGREVFRVRLDQASSPVPMTALGIIRENLRLPVSPQLTWPRILWEAGRLWGLKRATFHGKPRPMSSLTIRRRQRRWEKVIDTLCQSLVAARLNKAENGRLDMVFPDGSTRRFGRDDSGYRAVMRVGCSSVFIRLVVNGDVGLGEGWMEGDWDSDDLNAVLRFFLANRSTLSLSPWPRGFRWLQKMVLGLGRTLRGPLHRNTLPGSSSNIRAHYDLSNDFFRTFLDRTMTYSCAMFADPEKNEPLHEAQTRKYATLARKAGIGPGDHVLEIGGGWGGFALFAAGTIGCRVTGVTLSHEQYRLARERIDHAGLASLVDIRLEDYRLVTGTYDAVVSIEMLEAVGHGFHPRFFRAVDRLLAPGGRCVIQTITIEDGHYEIYRRSLCWIRKHIFPGGTLPSLTRIARVLTGHTGLNIMHAESLGLHYAATLIAWRKRFQRHLDRVRDLGFDDRFVRKWIYYLVSCEEGFRSGHVNDYQFVMARPEEQGRRLL